MNSLMEKNTNKMHQSQKKVSHVNLVLDSSSSMEPYTKEVIKMSEDQIQTLFDTSESLGLETRVSVYTFDHDVKCLIHDMDIKHTPSISDIYKPYGATALLDAFILSQQDLNLQSEKYGDHAFLTLVLTDGEENRSKNSVSEFRKYLTHPNNNRSIGFLVPNSHCVAYLTRCGVPKEAITVWDATSSKGFEEVSKTITQVTTSYLTARSQGVRSVSNVFSMGLDTVNKETVRKNLKPLDPNSFRILDVPDKIRIDEFVKNALAVNHYFVGSGSYLLTKNEHIQPQKEITIVEKSSGQAFTGSAARDLLGLTNSTMLVDVRGQNNPDYDIYVQSTAPNRNLMKGSKLLVRMEKYK